MRILLIGCGGFIGSHLMEALVKQGSHELVGWDVSLEKTRHLEGLQGLVLRCGDIYQPDNFELLRQDIKDADVVFNLAAICNPAEYNTRPLAVIRSNFIDSHRIVDACADFGTWVVHISTSEVYGRTLSSYVEPGEYSEKARYVLDEHDTPLVMGPIHNQRWSYACAKQLLERYIFALGFERSLPFTIVRPLNFFGPRMDYLPGRDREGTPRVLACFLSALLDGKPMYLVDGGLAMRTITSIHDATDALMRIVERPSRAQNEIFNIGNTDNEVTMRELAERMRKAYFRVTGKKEALDHPIVEISSRDFYGQGYEDCDRRMPNVDKAGRLLGWKASIPLDEILEETIAYYCLEETGTADGAGTGALFGNRAC